VKIPGTQPGLPAIEDMIAAGKSINVTLLFSLRRHAEVMEAYIRGLERLVAGGGDPKAVSSVASYFVSRVDTEADRRLDEIGGHDDLKGKLGVANAKLAYAQWREIFAGERWEFLESKGASKQWCLWASTSTKNPAYSDILYVANLIGSDTINTMPEETIEAFQDHGKVAVTIDKGLDKAKRVFERLAKAGVDYDDVTLTLEEEGVQKFADSFDELIDGIRAKKGDLVSA
jgi:transaldolase